MTKPKWESNEPNELLRLVDELYQHDQTAKIDLARIWEENIRFIAGDQYIRYNKTARNYEPIPERLGNETLPRGHDNQIYPRSEILRANLTKQNPVFDVTSNSSDPKDERAAKVALAVHDARSEMDEDKKKFASAANYGVATGNAFLKTAWQPKGKIPAVDEMGNEIKDPVGNTVYAPIGDFELMEVSPFCIAPGKGSTSMMDISEIMEYSVQDLDCVKEWFMGDPAQGYTGEAATLTAEDRVDNILRIAEALKDLAGDRGEKNKKENTVILKECYIKPSEKMPYGRMIVIANGKLLYVGESPYAKVCQKRWHPYKHFRYKVLPGVFWGITPIAQCVKLQRRLNAIDTMCILHRQTMAFGQWTIPVNSVKNSQITGRVGGRIEYTPGRNGEKPEKIPGVPLGQEVILERQGVKLSMDEICGTTDIMQGKQPGDIVSGVSLEIIREMSYSRHNPLYASWEYFNEEVAQHRLEIVAKLQMEERPEFSAVIRRRLRALTGLDIQTFSGSDIQDNTNIRITAGSTIPRSHAAKMAFLQKFGEAGLLGDLVQDPSKNQLFLAEFNIDNFKTTQNVDYQKSKYELGLLESGAFQQVQVDPHDDHAIHNAYFESKLKDPEYYSSRPPEVLQAAWAHHEQHTQAIQQASLGEQLNQAEVRDENAYVQSLIQNGGPNGDPPSPGLFPTATRKKIEAANQAQAPQGPPPGPQMQ